MPKGKIVQVPGLSDEYFVISNKDETKFALIKIVANAIRQHQLGIFDHSPSLEECNQQISALQKLESGK